MTGFEQDHTLEQQKSATDSHDIAQGMLLMAGMFLYPSLVTDKTEIDPHYKYLQSIYLQLSKIM